MYRLPVPARLILACLLLGGAPVASASTDSALQPGQAERARIPVSTQGISPIPVQAWDAASPQRLVRIDGALYQEDAGFYYRVVEDHVTVRPIEGVESWDELVRAAAARDASAFGLLQQAAVVRRNKLGIIDLRIPAPHDPVAWCELLTQTGLVRYAEIATYGVYTVAPSDPRYDEQWALNNTGQSGGTPGADVDAEAAWEIFSGDPATIVAVLDSGTDVDHEDLAPNTWHNPGEVPDNSVDDDGNGFVDDWEGWDFGNGNNDPRSSFFHGTHVTGIVNAAGNNGLGIVGLAGGLSGPGARTMALAVGEFGPVGGILDDAIIYAADNGAHIIQLSLSVSETTAINDALDYAYNTHDVFIDCAAGNNGASVGYPARRPEVMSVASTTDTDARSSFSNPGPENEIAAPGSDILSTQIGSTYGSSSGTSFAAPYVAGLAALIRGLNPGLPAPDVRQLILDTAEDVESPGFDNLTGWGRINAFAALSATATSDGAVRLNREAFSCSDTLAITLADIDLAGSGTIQVDVTSDTEGLAETVMLVETGAISGVFQGSIDTASGTPAADGLLQAADEDTLQVEYVDDDDGLGGNGVSKFAHASADCRAPACSSVAAGGITDVSVTITWDTDEPGTSVVRFGNATPPTQVVESTSLTTSHSVVLSGLTACTSYRYEVESGDALGNADVNDNGGAYFSFETFGNFPGSGIGPCHQGQPTFDKQAYGCSETVGITVTDIDLDSDSGTEESIQVLVTSTSEPAGEWITLTELGTESNAFAGSIELASIPPAEDGVLSSSPDDLLTVTYLDADDGDGNPRIAVTNAVTDCGGPKIFGVALVGSTGTRATIAWLTDEPATSHLEFGPTAGLGSVVEDTTSKTSHQFTVSAWDPCDRAYFRISGTDVHGNLAVADVEGQPFEFNLNQIGGMVFHDNFEVDLGWTLAGEWDRGTPQGLGSAGADPAGAYSGELILGTDLSGTGTFPGDYEPVVKDRAMSPAFSTLGVTNLELIVRRKLGVTDSDEATIWAAVPTPQLVWNNEGSIDDADWNEVRIDFSEADDRPGARVMFQIESEDPGQSYGWNLDEVIVKDSTQPDYLACGGCGGGPSFAGLVAAADAAPCGAGGTILDWEGAASWGTGSGGTYDVYRGGSSDFVPAAGNRVATGLTGTTWTDTSAPNDTEVWYVVRARNDESCVGGEGLDDGNLVRLNATDSTAVPLPDPVNSSLLGYRVGGAHVRLSWDAAVGATSYVVRRSTTPDFATSTDVGTSDTTLFEDVNAVSNPQPFYYLVVPADACGNEAP